MTQEEKIKELKKLAIAYRCALEFDNCPESSEADFILENIFDHDKNELIDILDKYKGWSPSDIEGSVFRKIGQL